MASDGPHSSQGAQDHVMATTEDECPFCDRIAAQHGLLAASGMCVAFYGAKPLNPGHVLIDPYRHEPDFLALLPEERNAILRMAVELRPQLDEQHRPDGLNLGANIGEAAGQTIGQAHLHLIHRNWGDVPDPRGGTRCLIPERARDGEIIERVDSR